MTLARFGTENNSIALNTVAAGRVAGTVSRVQGPNVSCEMVMITANPDNTGKVYVGGSNVSSTEGIPLAAGSSTGWIPVNNVNSLWFIMSSVNDHAHYLIIR